MSKRKRLLLGVAVVAGLVYLYGWRIANALVLHFVGCPPHHNRAVYVDAVDARTGAFLPPHLYHESTLIVRDGDLRGFHLACLGWCRQQGRYVRCHRARAGLPRVAGR